MTGKELHLFFVPLCRHTNGLFISCNLCPVRLPHGAAGLKPNIMLYNITWQHYCLYVAIALALWYSVFFWIYYGSKAGNLFKKGNGKHLPDCDLPDPDETDEDLLGKPVEEYGVSTAESQDISFNTKTAGARKTDAERHEDNLRGALPDLMEELKLVLQTVQSEQGSKEDFLALLEFTLPKYPGITSRSKFEAIAEWINNNSPFELTQEELSRLWD